MIVGRARKRREADSGSKTENKHDPKADPELALKRYVENRDYSGAVTFIEFERDELHVPWITELRLWHAYCLFHNGDYPSAVARYREILADEPNLKVINHYIATCYMHNEEYEEAKMVMLEGPYGDLKSRLRFQLAHRLHDERELVDAHSQLAGTLENQLSLAAVHYLQGHYGDAVEIYERLLVQHPEYLALNVYISMCKYKLEQWEESSEAVDLYLNENTDSAVALNLKACTYMAMFTPDLAESQILQIKKFATSSYDFADVLVQHNLCVFKDGIDGFKVLPKLVGLIPEARYNLALLHMRANNTEEADELMRDHQHMGMNEGILKGAVMLEIGQAAGDRGAIEEANEILAGIGESEDTRDLIPGRKCLASSKFITGEYDQTLLVLQSIEDHAQGSEEYNYDKGMTLAALSKWEEAEEYLYSVYDSCCKDLAYLSWLCRCYVKNGKGEAAWMIYLDMTSPDDSQTLLRQLCGDCFAAGLYYYAMRAYDILCKCGDGDEHFKKGLIASCVAVFRGVLTKKESSDKLSEVISILSGEPDAAQVLQFIENYAMESDY